MRYQDSGHLQEFDCLLIIAWRRRDKKRMISGKTSALLPLRL